MSKNKEMFYRNQAEACGKIQRTWTWNDDLFLIVRATEHDRITARVKIDQALASGLTIEKGQTIGVRGHLVDNAYLESGRQFLKRTTLKEVDTLPQSLLSVQRKRVATYLEVESFFFADGPDGTEPRPKAVVEGIASRIWQTHSGRHQSIRLAVYDRFCQTVEGNNGKKLPRRQAHFITVQCPAGNTRFQVKDHIIVQGTLSGFLYDQNFQDFLSKAKPHIALSAIPGGEDLASLMAVRSTTKVIANSIIKISK